MPVAVDRSIAQQRLTNRQRKIRRVIRINQTETVAGIDVAVGKRQRVGSAAFLERFSDRRTEIKRRGLGLTCRSGTA